MPERVHALSPSRHAHYYALGGVFAKIVLTIGSFVLATGVGQGSGSGDDADADAGSNKFILYNLTQIFVGMVLLIIAAVRLPFAVGKSNAIRWAIGAPFFLIFYLMFARLLRWLNVFGLVSVSHLEPR